jgi:hypothetical protein
MKFAHYSDLALDFIIPLNARLSCSHQRRQGSQILPTLRTHTGIQEEVVCE